MQIALGSKRKLRFIDSLIPILEDDPKKEEEWWKVNTLVGSWILNTIESSLRTSITYSKRVDELRTELKECFLGVHRPRKYEIKATLANCKQGEDSAASVYYAKLKKLRDECANNTQIPSCECGALTAITKERGEEKSYQFFYGFKRFIFWHCAIEYNPTRTHPKGETSFLNDK